MDPRIPAGSKRPLARDSETLARSTLSAVGAAALRPFVQEAQPGLGLGQGLLASHPPSGAPGSSTQRWEHRTAVFTFSTKAVTSVWYFMSALEVSLFLTGQSRGEGGQHSGRAWELGSRPSITSVHARELGSTHQTCLHFCPAPPPAGPSRVPQDDSVQKQLGMGALRCFSKAAQGSRGPDLSLLGNRWGMEPWGTMEQRRSWGPGHTRQRAQGCGLWLLALSPRRQSGERRESPSPWPLQVHLALQRPDWVA